MSDRPFSLGTGPSFRLGRGGGRPHGGGVSAPTLPRSGSRLRVGFALVCRSQPPAGVDRRAVLVGAEVQVATGGVARRPGVADQLATLHAAAELHDARQVVVARDEVDAAADAVVDEDLVAPPAGP